MAMYTIRIHHNETDETGESASGSFEYDIGEAGEGDYQEMQTHLLSAIGLNLASIAEFLARVAQELEAMRTNR